MARVSEKLREQVTERAGGLCEYCQAAQLTVVTMEIDHIIPISAGGSSDFDNLCLTCRGCNTYKLDYQTGLDPDTADEVELFNPRLHEWSAHFQWVEAGTIILGLTASGRATVQRLRMNRPEVVRARQRWVKAGWHPPKQAAQG